MQKMNKKHAKLPKIINQNTKENKKKSLKNDPKNTIKTK